MRIYRIKGGKFFRSLALAMETNLQKILLLLVNVVGLAVYLYTIYYAFDAMGVFAAILSAGLPVLANIYWMYHITMDTGDLMNNYNLACGSIVLGYVLLLVFTDAGKEENDEVD